MNHNTAIVIGLGTMIVDRIQRAREMPPIFIWESLPFGHNAMTIPPIGIFIKRSEQNNDLLLQHELIHWRQYQDRGTLMFYVDYFLGLLAGYDDHPMEKEARYLESDFAQQHYTYSVRNGLAATVYNPDFRT